MIGNLYVARRKSAKGNYYKCVVFKPDSDKEHSITVSFDPTLMYKLAEEEGVLLREYVIDEVDE